MSLQIKYAQFKTFDDLVRLAAMSPTPFLQHVEMGGTNLYFVQVLGIGGGRMVYYVEREEKIGGRYIVFNRFNDEVTFSDKLISDGQSACIKILELEKTSAFPEYPPNY